MAWCSAYELANCSDPRNSMCSTKWDRPFERRVSYRAPTPAYSAIDVVCRWGVSMVTTRRPLARRVRATRYGRGRSAEPGSAAGVDGWAERGDVRLRFMSGGWRGAWIIRPRSQRPTRRPTEYGPAARGGPIEYGAA